MNKGLYVSYRPLPLPKTDASADLQVSTKPLKNHVINRMGKSLKFICIALQKARDIFINSKNKSNYIDDNKNEQLGQVLLHNIGIFSDGSKLCDKMPTNSGRNTATPLLMYFFFGK
jgi:hypothetical protein